MKNIFLFVLVSICMYACKKGDAGAQGPQGLQGSQGIQGVKGDNGSMIYSGTDVPAASLGVNGDFYFRLSNSTLFGPKVTGGWGFGVNLRGATGATGAANVIYSGWMSFQQVQRDTIIDATTLKVNHIPAPRLTQSIIDAGIVIVYWRFQSTVFQLPYTSDAGAGNGSSKTSTISFVPKPGRIFITRYTHDNSASVGFGAVQFRYVIIPGGIVATLKNKNIDVKDPFAVDKALQKL